MFHLQSYRVRNFRGRVSYFNQSEAREQSFLASDWLKLETLPRKYRTLEYGIFGEGSHISTNQKREKGVFSLLIG